MPSQHSDRDRDACVDILDDALAARGFIAGLSFEAFAADQRTHYAVVRCIEIISEATRHLSTELRGRHPQIPWRDIADVGNLYRHAYHRVLLDIVWGTVHEPLTAIIAVCRAELDGLPPAVP